LAYWDLRIPQLEASMRRAIENAFLLDNEEPIEDRGVETLW